MLQRHILEPVRFVLPYDDALEESTDWQAYIDSGLDYGLLKFKEGQRPTIFTVRQLTHRQRVSRGNLEGYSQHMFTVRCGLVSVSGLEVKKGGAVVSVESPRLQTEGTLGDLVRQEWFDQSGLTETDVVSLANVIYCISEAQLPLLARYVSAVGAGT